MKNQPFLLLLIALLIGIFVGEFTNHSISTLQLTIISGIFGLLSYYFLTKKSLLSSIFLLVVISLTGYQLIKLEKSIPENHYSKVITNQNIVQIRLLEKLKPTKKYNKYFAQIEYLLNPTKQPTRSTGIVMVYLPKQQNELIVDDQLVVKSNYFELEFSKEYEYYFTYLKRKGVYGNLYVKDILFVNHSNTWKSKLEKWKIKTTESLQKYGYNQNVVALIQSLIFGDRSEIDQKITKSFQNLGVIHILSISGLHTTIIYSIFYLFFSYLFSSFGGKRITISLSLIAVIGFLFFVGLKPAVLRATLMLLLYFGSYFFERKSSIHHTLYLSAFILLVFSPNFIFDVGFQLSYLAVFFIVWLYPLFKMAITKNKIANYFLNIISVSLAAQVGTFPIILYYFKTIGMLFLVGNIIFIPFTYIFIIFSFFSLFFSIIGINYTSFIFLLNTFTDFVLGLGIKLSKFNFFVLNEISFNVVEVILSLIICLCLPYIFTKNYRIKTIYLAIFLLLLLNFF